MIYLKLRYLSVKSHPFWSSSFIIFSFQNLIFNHILYFVLDSWQTRLFYQIMHSDFGIKPYVLLCLLHLNIYLV